MNVIRPQDPFLKNVAGEQEVRLGNVYRKIDFCFLDVVDDVPIAYNSLTTEIVELTQEEYGILMQETIEATADVERFIKKWFLVPVDYNEIALVDEVRAFKKMIPSSSKPEVTSYTIFPTLDCNARCFYCFELGCSRKTMDEKTARDTADFILRTRGSKEVRLIWFGGEPLYNSPVIDIICGALKDAGVKFTSLMVSNSYLFDEKTVEKAVELWNLYRVQVTLDGTEQIYNKIKAYIYKNEKSPFAVVTDNIEQLAKAGVSVLIRFNLTPQNRENLYELVDFLCERYKDYPNVLMYPHLLFETEENYAKEGSLERRLAELDQLLDLEQYCIDKNKAYIAPVDKKIRNNSCMADEANGYMISPEGFLGTCEHYTDSEFVGNVIDGVQDVAKKKKNAEYWNCEELCKGCRVYPTCLRLKSCPTKFYKCDAANRKLLETQAQRRLAYTYRKIKEKENKAE